MNSVQAKSLTRSQAMRRRLVLQITTVVGAYFHHQIHGAKYLVGTLWVSLLDGRDFLGGKKRTMGVRQFLLAGRRARLASTAGEKTCVVQPQMVAIPCVAHTRELDTNPVAFYGQDVQRRRTACASATARR